MTDDASPMNFTAEEYELMQRIGGMAGYMRVCTNRLRAARPDLFGEPGIPITLPGGEVGPKPDGCACKCMRCGADVPDLGFKTPYRCGPCRPPKPRGGFRFL